MGKELYEMTLEELWQLFPIILGEHNPEYKEWYKEEEFKILDNIDDELIARINHIGSSAVPGLVAKPTVDILLELKSGTDADEIKNMIEELGWGIMSSQKEPYLHLVFQKGYTKEGFAEKVYHLHVRYLGDWSELYFRDYLIENKNIADAYGEVKLGLIEEYKNNRDGYTEAKTEFIKMHTRDAREKYGDRYVSVESQDDN